MAYTTINKSTLHFNTKTYAGNGGSSTDAITGINFRPDLVWIKARNNAYNHNLYDVVRGLSSGAILSNSTSAEDSTQRISSFDSDGFTLPATNYTYVNASGTNYVAWNWKAGNSAGSSNSDGNITSTVSVNTTAGFSIVKYTGNETGTRTIGHGLGAVPQVIIIKNLDDGSLNWPVYHHKVGATKYLLLNDNAAEIASSNYWADTTPTSSVFSVGGNHNVNKNSQDFIAYCFAEKIGFSKFGSYVGNGSTDGTYVHTGFKPAWLMYHRSNSGTSNWGMHNAKVDVDNPVQKGLIANGSAVEDTHDFVDFTSNGFKLRSSSANRNGNGDTYIYMAFAEEPVVGSNNIPATAR